MKLYSLSAALLLSLLLLCAGLALAAEDPELVHCKHLCKQPQYDEEDKKECEERCDEYFKEKREKEHEGKEKSREREHEEIEKQRKRVKELCQKKCERQEERQQRALCRLQCRQKFGQGEGEQDQMVEEDNPYVFTDRHFKSRVKTEQGRIDILQRFIKKSQLLSGIDQYRVITLEANPLSFVAPSHLDADSLIFVVNGRGIISMIREGKTQSYKIEPGDVVRAPAGTPVYYMNRDEIQKLYIVTLLLPVNRPGKFKPFHGPGGENPKSYYGAFSPEIMEAALKTNRGKLEGILRQSEGGILKASKEQIEAMAHREEGGGIWPFGGESEGPFNLLHKRPVRSNNYGKLFEASPREYQQLRDFDVIVSFANITQGCMAGPFYNSRATKIAMVVDGDGYMEMASPHFPASSEEQQGGSQEGKTSPTTYRKLSSGLRRGTMFVVPAGHPVALVADENSNLNVLCFEVNARGNTRYTLAGKNNIVSAMEREAKELGFGVGAQEVDDIFGKQKDELFYPGPSRQHGRADA